MSVDVGVRLSIADALGKLMKEGLPFRFEAFDGSVAGPVDAPFTLRLLNERGLSYLMTAPGDLGFARAYVAGDLELDGIHPGDPYDAMVLIMSQLRFKVPMAAEMVQIVRSLGFGNLKPPPPPAEEHLP
ncbi:MAG: SAM-dependent methyltransferase [Aeromicrobium sp.]|nr:SAM-dependent methyltransferase [Aeromicrobium sp.]